MGLTRSQVWYAAGAIVLLGALAWMLVRDETTPPATYDSGHGFLRIGRWGNESHATPLDEADMRIHVPYFLDYLAKANESGRYDVKDPYEMDAIRHYVNTHQRPGDFSWQVLYRGRAFTLVDYTG